MIKNKLTRISILLIISVFGLNSCNGADARKVSPDPRERVKKKYGRR